jgi:hypothetical protein
MAKAKSKHEALPNNEIRRRMLRYFYDRNATSNRGKKGSAVRIGWVRLNP